MEKTIIYNGVRYTKHPNQKYYYCSQSVKFYSRSLHRQIWFDNFGEIPKGYDIHHIDHNHFNNDISNMRLIPRSEHISYHMKLNVLQNPNRFKELAEIGRPLTKEWHGSADGIEWHKQHAKNFNFGSMVYGSGECMQCKSVFEKKTAFAKYCSNSCKSKYRRVNKLDMQVKCCKFCSKEFTTAKYNGAEYCSKKCYADWIRI